MPTEPHETVVPARAMRRDAQRNRVLLLRAAREVFAEKGFEASMDEIASRAGLGVGTAYRHFANKFELANSIFERAVESFVDSATAVSAKDDPWQALVAVIDRTLQAQTRNRAVREILLGAHEDGASYHESMIAPLQPAFDRAKEAGAVRADAEYSDLAFVLTMLCAVADSTDADAPETWRRYLPTLLAGLRPDGPPLPKPVSTT